MSKTALTMLWDVMLILCLYFAVHMRGGLAGVEAESAGAGEKADVAELAAPVVEVLDGATDGIARIKVLAPGDRPPPREGGENAWVRAYCAGGEGQAAGTARRARSRPPLLLACDKVSPLEQCLENQGLLRQFAAGCKLKLRGM